MSFFMRMFFPTKTNKGIKIALITVKRTHFFLDNVPYRHGEDSAENRRGNPSSTESNPAESSPGENNPAENTSPRENNPAEDTNLGAEDTDSKEQEQGINQRRSNRVKRTPEYLKDYVQQND